MTISNIQPWQPPSIGVELPQVPARNPSTETAPGVAPGTVSKEFSEFFKEVNQSQLQAEHAMTDYANGRQNDLHGTMIAIEKADISFRLLANIRNKALDAYREIMRMGG